MSDLDGRELEAIDAVSDEAGGWNITLWYAPPPPVRKISFTRQATTPSEVSYFGNCCHYHADDDAELARIVADLKRENGWPAL